MCLPLPPPTPLPLLAARNKKGLVILSTGTEKGKSVSRISSTYSVRAGVLLLAATEYRCHGDPYSSRCALHDVSGNDHASSLSALASPPLPLVDRSSLSPYYVPDTPDRSASPPLIVCPLNHRKHVDQALS